MLLDPEEPETAAAEEAGPPGTDAAVSMLPCLSGRWTPRFMCLFSSSDRVKPLVAAGQLGTGQKKRLTPE